jgi:hypothetical protein
MLLAELCAKASDVDVDGSRATEVLIAPDPRQQHLSGENVAGVRREEAEQLVLHEGEVERPSSHHRLVGLEVEG